MKINLASFFSPINRYTISGFFLLMLGFFLLPFFFLGLPVMIAGIVLLLYGFYDFFLNIIPGGKKLKQAFNKQFKYSFNWFRQLWQEAMKK